MGKGRPTKIRIIRREPEIKQFSPRGRIGRPGYSGLKFEEFEAIRLTDYMGLDQAQSAERMKISQQTFSRILRKARKCIAEALIKGDIIKISGGTFKVEGAEKKSYHKDAKVPQKRKRFETRSSSNGVDAGMEA